MTAVLNNTDETLMFQDFLFHPAWHGKIYGLTAERMIRDFKTPFLYMIREGEKSNVASEQNYYITYLDANLTVRHQPIMVTLMSEGRYFSQGGNYGPCNKTTINDLIHLFMHCKKEDCVPLVK